MFATMRRRRRSAKMKQELGQSVDHFKRAANIAAQETSATVAPRINAAKGKVQPAVSQAKDAASTGWESAVATLTPLITAASENVRKPGKKAGEVSKRQVKTNKKKARKLEKRANRALGRKQGGRGRLIRLALAGAAVGAGAAYVIRKRKAAQWDEYDPSVPVAPVAPVAPAAPVPPAAVAEPARGADDAAFEPSDSPATNSAVSTDKK